MEFNIRLALLLYMPMLPYTLVGFGFFGLAATLYKHRINWLLYWLLAALPINLVIAYIYVLNVSFR